MQWDDNNGDKKRILTQAEIKFRERITTAKEANNTITPQLLDYLQSIGIDIHNREEMIQYLKEHGNKAIQEAIAEQQEMQDIKAKAIADGTFMKAPNGKDTNLTERQWLQVRTKAFKNWFGDWEKYAKFAASFVNNNNVLTIKENEYTDEFRRIQEESRSLLPEKVSTFHKEGLPRRDYDNLKRSLGTVYAGLLSRGSSRSLGSRSLTSVKHGTTFNILQVNGSLFHDIFEINRNYLQNGELVDLHETYDNCKCYLSDDGLCGFAIEPDGNLVSVFSLNPSDKKGFLYAIKDFIAEEGATHLDAYASKTQNLELIYAKTLGFHTASSMDYNMEYDHDNIAENHGKPKVVFMVNQPTDRKTFDKNSYDDALNYAKSRIKALDRNASKVVDENGEPLVVYHRSPNKFTTFDTSKIGTTTDEGQYGKGFYFGNKPNRAEGSYVYSVFLNIKNPYIVNEDDSHSFVIANSFNRIGEKSKISETIFGSRLTEDEKRLINSKDGIIEDTKEEFVVSNPNQTKSATDNNGMFSTENDDIQAIQTPQGEVYAFADPNGNLYFDETVISSEHPIHEYTHLWDRVVAKNNPQLWLRGIILMKETSLWKEVEDESNEIPALFYFFKKSTNILFLIIRHLTAYSFSQERRKNNSYYKVTKKFTIFAENNRFEKKTYHFL